MTGYAARVYIPKTQEYETDFFVNLDDALSVRDRYFNVSIYYAHTEKKGYNTIVILDAPVRDRNGFKL